MAKIIIPTPLRKFTDQNREFTTDSSTLSAAIDQLVSEYPEVKANLLDDEGNIRSFIKVYIGDDQVDPNGEDTITLDDSTEVSIVPAIAGGTR